MRIYLLLFISIVASCCEPSANLELHQAVVEGNLEEVNNAIANGADINTRTVNFKSPLYLAVEQGHYAIAEALLHSGANADLTDLRFAERRGVSPLVVAIENGQLPLVRLLIQQGANFSYELFDGSTPLIRAVWAGNISIVKVLLEAGAPVNYKTYNYGRTALLEACRLQRTEIVDYLLAHNAIPSRTNWLGRNATWYAYQSNDSTLIKLFSSHLDSQPPDITDITGVRVPPTHTHPTSRR